MARSLVVFAVLFVALTMTSTPRARAADAGAPAVPACVGIKTTSRYVPYGYNHVVILTNGCAREARCTVSTDVAPAEQSVDVPPSQTIEVTTFVGSPSSTFTARVRCTLKERLQ